MKYLWHVVDITMTYQWHVNGIADNIGAHTCTHLCPPVACPYSLQSTPICLLGNLNPRWPLWTNEAVQLETFFAQCSVLPEVVFEICFCGSMGLFKLDMTLCFFLMTVRHAFCVRPTVFIGAGCYSTVEGQWCGVESSKSTDETAHRSSRYNNHIPRLSYDTCMQLLYIYAPIELMSSRYNIHIPRLSYDTCMQLLYIYAPIVRRSSRY